MWEWGHESMEYEVWSMEYEVVVFVGGAQGRSM